MNCVVEILVPHTTRLNLAPLLYTKVYKNALVRHTKNWKIRRKYRPLRVGVRKHV